MQRVLRCFTSSEPSSLGDASQRSAREEECFSQDSIAEPFFSVLNTFFSHTCFVLQPFLTLDHSCGRRPEGWAGKCNSQNHRVV